MRFIRGLDAILPEPPKTETPTSTPPQEAPQYGPGSAIERIHEQDKLEYAAQSKAFGGTHGGYGRLPVDAIV
jgi:hypothetical protein